MTRPTLTIDTERYQHYLDDTTISEAEKQELLNLLWTIITDFITLGFHIHPVQIAQKIPEKHTISEQTMLGSELGIIPETLNKEGDKS